MDVIHGVKTIQVNSNRLSIVDKGQEVARATVLLLPSTDLHPGQYFGYLEDVWVNQDFRGKGYGKKIVQEAIAFAAANTYKLIATTRHPPGHHVYDLYAKLGFEPHGTGFRMNFPSQEDS